MIIGSGLKDCDKVQKSVRKDPFPQVPFHEDSPFHVCRESEMVVTTVIVILVTLGIGLLWVWA